MALIPHLPIVGLLGLGWRWAACPPPGGRSNRSPGRARGRLWTRVRSAPATPRPRPSVWC